MARVALLDRLGHGRANVTLVDDVAAEACDAVGEPGVPDRRRAHVDASTAGAEVEPGADDGDRTGSLRGAHARRL